MAIRMPFPADVNPEPEAKFSRSMAEAFPASPWLATAPRRARTARTGVLLAAVAALLLGLALTGCSGAAAQEPIASTSAADLKRATAGAWSCPGMHAEWLDETTVQCVKESP